MNQILPNPLKWLKYYKTCLLLFLLVFMLNRAKTQDLYDLSRCIKTGLEQNFSLQVERNRESIEANNFTLGNAGMLPKITNTNRLGGSLITCNKIIAMVPMLRRREFTIHRAPHQ